MIRTLNSYAYEVWEILRKKIVDDDEIDIRLIKDLIVDQRALVLTNSMNKGGTGSGYPEASSASGYDGGWDQYVQTIQLDMSEITPLLEDYLCVEYPFLWKSSEAFPNTLTLGRRPAVIRVMPSSTADNAVMGPIIFSSHDRARFVGNGRFNSKQMVAYIRNGHLWIMTKDTLTDPYQVDVDAVLQDPRDVPGFDDDVDDFPMGKNWPYIMDNVRKFMEVKLKATQDRLNDATNE